MPAEPTSARNRQALLLGLTGVVIFGLTLPATRLAVADFDPLFVTAGRSLVAAALATVALLWARPPPPQRREWPRLAAFAGFSIIGFPLLMAIAMQYAPASHGAVVLAVLPLLTAMAGALVGGRAPVPRVLGLRTGGNRQRADLLAPRRRRFRRSALGRPAARRCPPSAAAMAYALGGEMARRIGGWEVISWALVFSAPVMLAAGPAVGPDQLGRQRLGLGRLPLRVRVQHVPRFLRLEQGHGDGRHRQDRPDPAAAAVRGAGSLRAPARRVASAGWRSVLPCCGRARGPGMAHAGRAAGHDRPCRRRLPQFACHENRRIAKRSETKMLHGEDLGRQRCIRRWLRPGARDGAWHRHSAQIGRGRFRACGSTPRTAPTSSSTSAATRAVRQDHQGDRRAEDGRQEPRPRQAQPADRRARHHGERQEVRRQQVVGHALQPRDGKSYSGTITVKSKDAVDLSGCVAAVLCKTVTWTRIK